MEKRTAEKLREAADSCGIDCKVDEKYSGRGMFGNSTTGIIFDSHSDLMVCAIQVAYEIGQTEQLPQIVVEGESEYTEPYDIEEFLDDIQNLRQDNMGRSLIFY